MDTGTVEYIDADGDGYLSDEDCDDTNTSSTRVRVRSVMASIMTAMGSG